MRESGNILDISSLNPDMMGFIFYEKSSRYAGDFLDAEVFKDIPGQIQKTGVFVNSDSVVINKICTKYNFDIIQLHGNEPPETCKKLGRYRKIIKAFAVDYNFDFNTCKKYDQYCDYFLFDTKGEKYGGNSISFDWEILKKYKGQTPFLLSGGIGPENVNDIKSINHKQLTGIDINSQFETEPGFKDVGLVEEFITRFRE